jgi:hypothetical protein
VNPARSPLMLRDGTGQLNSALLAEWTAGSNPSYTLSLPQGAKANFSLDGDERLTFDLGRAGEESTTPYVTVELVDTDGSVAVQPANRYGVVPPLMPAKLEKAGRVSKALGFDFFPKIRQPYEQVLQSFEIPLSTFAVANPEFDATRIATIRFWFNDEKAGRAYLDEIGFRG